MPQNTAQIRVGRLLEIRVSRGYETPADVDAMMAMSRAVASALPPDVKHVTVADWRRCRLMTEEACERAIVMFQGMNPRTERSALLCGDGSATAAMQFLRLVMSGDNPNRRLFRSADEMIEWLSEVLTQEEIRRLREFLAEG